MTEEDRRLWNTFMVYPYGLSTWDVWSRLPTWDQLDQASMKISRLAESAVVQSSWEARGLSCLPLSVQSEDHIHQIMQCLLVKTKGANQDDTWILNILDCWQIAGCLFGKDSASAAAHKLLDESKFHACASGMSPVLRQKLLSFLMQGLNDWTASAESESVLSSAYVSQSVVMMRCIWYMCLNKDEEARVVEYLSLLVRIRDKSRSTDSTQGWLNEEYIIDFTACVSFRPVRPSDIMEQWTWNGKLTELVAFQTTHVPCVISEITLHIQALIQALVQHHTILGGTMGIHISTAAVLLAARQQEPTSSSFVVTKDFFLALEQINLFSSKAVRLQAHLNSNPHFW
jgi:hypothetical protein